MHPRPRWLLPLILALSTPLAALEVEDIRCICADDIRHHGDYVACVSHLSRRLVASGQLTPRERVALVRDAARSGQAPDAPCASGPPRWGVGVQADLPVKHPGEIARVEGLLWNFTDDHVTGLGSADGADDGPDECLFDIELRDMFGQAVHREAMPCSRAVTEFPLEPGRARRLAADMALVYLGSETGQPDGSPLDPGAYVLRVDVRAAYPNQVQSPDGIMPVAEVLIHVEP